MVYPVREYDEPNHKKKTRFMKRPRFFALEELLDSSVARQKGISNSPSWSIVENLNELACVLDDIREAWSRTPEGKGTGIRVTSGYRCPKLNTAVGGAKNSAHMCGLAADLVPVNGKIDAFAEFLKKWLPKYDRSFDQLIWESRGKSRWIHFGWMSPSGGQRRQMFGISVPL